MKKINLILSILFTIPASILLLMAEIDYHVIENRFLGIIYGYPNIMYVFTAAIALGIFFALMTLEAEKSKKLRYLPATVAAIGMATLGLTILFVIGGEIFAGL